jgi:ABC-2 type transport system permease protein
MSAEATNAGVIHDIGYRSYAGQRYGRRQIVLALTWYSLRSAFGIGRGVKAKILPVITFVLMCLPAAVSAVQIATTPGHQRVLSYDVYNNGLRIVVMLVFIAMQAPELVSRDLRSHSLPLYFARPISRIDYPIAKLAGFIMACLAMIEIPLLLLYIGSVSQVGNATGVWHETKALIPGLLLGLAWAVVLASLSLLLASVSGRRVFAVGAVAISFFLTFVLAHLLIAIGGQAFGPHPVGGPGPVAVAVQADTLSRLAGLISPFTVLDGMRQWLGGTTPTFVPNPGNYGPLYGVMSLILVVIGVGGLIVRYRKVGVA